MHIGIAWHIVIRWVVIERHGLRRVCVMWMHFRSRVRMVRRRHVGIQRRQIRVKRRTLVVSLIRVPRVHTKKYI